MRIARIRWSRPRGPRLVALLATLGILVLAGAVVVGRVSADAGGAHDRGYRAGVASGHDGGYFDGLAAGQAQGREEGRALQAANEVPAASRQPVQDAFSAGYAAGSNDAFGNYDGGWGLGEPYLITVDRSSGQTVYRISSRTLLLPDTDYFLCPDRRSVCQAPRR